MSDAHMTSSPKLDAGLAAQSAPSAEAGHAGSDEPVTAEASPFGERASGPFRGALRAAAYVLLIAVAGGLAWFATRNKAEAEAMAQHQHGAAAAADVASPVALDAASARRIGVTFATAAEGALAAEVRTVGQVTYDETRVKAIAPKIEGWVERLFVDFTGREVAEGEPLLSIYSPMLVSAQEELLLALRLARDVANGTDEAKRAADDMVASARRRLEYWDIPASDIEQLERTGVVTKTLTLRSPAEGVVVEKSVFTGQRIMEGESLYRVADLRTVWVEGEIFESDLSSVRMGARVDVELQAYPGRRWAGAVTYVYPTVDPGTRTTRIRVELRNPALQLRPGMYATIRVPGAQRAGVITIPRTAVVSTGKRVLAFVRMDDGMLQPREIVTGLSSDDRVEVLQGLTAGEVVVSSATFLIDAESNLGASLAAMANMPGMDMVSPKTAPGTTSDMPGKNSAAPNSASHEMATPGMNAPRPKPAPDAPTTKPPTHNHRPE